MSVTALTPALQPLHAVPLRRTRFEVALSRPLDFQDPIHSIARGLMAQNLRGMRCLTKAPRCDGCDAAARCDYAALIGAPGTSRPPDEHRPFWLQDLPLGTPSHPAQPRYQLATDAPLVASLVWNPPSIPRAAHLHAALSDALEALGAAPFANAVRLVEDVPIAWPTDPTAPDAVRLEARSPLALFNGKPDDDRQRVARSLANCPDAPGLALIAAMGLHRLDALAERFGPHRLNRLRLPDLRAVRATDGELSRTTVWRFSHAQQKRIPVDVLVGACTLRGPGLSELFPILQALTVTSVGRLSSLGFGHLSVEPA